MSRIPVTVLTGFLGSGKTTLLNRILSEKQNQRIAVIENEFGEAGIDQDLVINADEEIVEMNNGCICCTVRGDLIRILNKFLEQEKKIDRVIIETTGMAQPGPVAQTFFVDPTVRENYELDGVITLVDAAHVEKHWESSEEVLSQIAFADRILLNKKDLVSEEKLNFLIKGLRNINAVVDIIPVSMGETDIAPLLSMGGFDLERALELKPQFLEPEHHTHDHSVGSVSLEIPGDLHAGKLETLLNVLVEIQGEDIFRMKGILSIKDEPERYIFQGVHMLFSISSASPWGEEQRFSRMVFIGRNLNKNYLEQAFRGCSAP